MAQPIEKNGAGDGARTRDLRRDRPDCPLVVSTLCSENKRAESPKLSERAALAGLAMLALAGTASAQPATRAPYPALPSDGYLTFFTDGETGCQYLSRDGRALTPRIAADGKTHMGCKEAKGEAK